MLDGQTVFVTGGASGLGAQVCALALQAGATVAIADRHARSHAEHARAMDLPVASVGSRMLVLEIDVGRDDEVRDALAHVVAHTGRLDAVVNCAAIDVTAPIDTLEVDQWDDIVRTNLTGTFLVAKRAVDVMRPAGRGHIVNIASTASRRAWPNAAAYHATKWGVLGLSHALHAELRPYGIKVSAVLSGGMRTPFLFDRFPDLDPGLLMDPVEVARAVLFTLSTPEGVVVPEIMVLPMRETSWP